MPWEVESLRQSLRKDGLQDPILRYEHAILDGTHRYGLCLELDIPPRFVDFAGSRSEAVALVSARLHTRTLSQSQRSMIAARLRRLDEGKSPLSKPQAAAEAGVSETLVTYSTKIDREGDPALSEAVANGAVNVLDAYNVLDRAKDVQRRAVVAVRRGEFKSVQEAVQVIDPPPVVDDDETPVPAALQAIFASAPDFKAVTRELKKVCERVERVESTAAAVAVAQRRKAGQWKQYSAILKAAARWAQESRPSKICHDCLADPKRCTTCSSCAGKGWLTVQESSSA